MRSISAGNLTALSLPQWLIDFVRIEISPTQILTISNHFHDIVLNGETYTGLGQLVGFSDISTTLDAKDQALDISLAGVDGTVKAVILSLPVEGASVSVARGFYNSETAALYAPPIVRWVGTVNNYSIEDTSDIGEINTSTISISCKSIMTTILERSSGRFTSDAGFKEFNPTDKSMEFVASLANFSPRFGQDV